METDVVRVDCGCVVILEEGNSGRMVYCATHNGGGGAIRVSIDPEGDAFDPAPELEAARLLRQAADRLEGGARDFALLDVNGNTVGRLDWSE